MFGLLRIGLLLIFSHLILSACGGGGSDGNVSTPPPVQNSAPNISGSPSSSVEEDIAYSFIPSVSDPDGDTLSFSIQNRPAWATFDNSTGELTGTPTRDDVGLYEGIEISVSDGAITTRLSSFDIEVIQVESVTLAGIVTDAPVPNAVVTVDAGEYRVETQADGAGAYSAELRIRTSNFDNEVLLTITGRGVNSRDALELRSIVGRLGDIFEQAGADETLTSAENRRLNVTHVSTARYLLGSDNNFGITPDNASALALAEQAIDIDQLLDVAGLIKLIIDKALIAIPMGETTLSFLESDAPDVTNRAHINSILADNGYIDPDGNPVPSIRDALNQMITATLADSAVIGSMAEEMIAGTTVWTTPAYRGRLPEEGNVLDFAINGRGVAYENVKDRLYFIRNGSPGDPNQIAEPFSWEIVDNRLVLSFDDYTTQIFPTITDTFAFLVADYGFDQTVADFLVQARNEGRLIDSQIPITTKYIGRSITMVDAVGDKLQIHATEEQLHSIDEYLLALGWADPLPRGQTFKPFTSLIDTVGLVPISTSEAPASGESWAVPILYSPSEMPLATPAPEGLYADLFRLDAGGTTAAGALSQQTYEWSSSAEGLTLKSGADSWTYTALATDGDLFLGLVTYRVNGNIVFRSAQWLAQASGSVAPLINDLVQPSPLFWSSGLGKSAASHYLPDGRLDPQFIFGYQFLDGTQLSRIYCCDIDVNGNPTLVREAPNWLWSTADSTIILERNTPGFLRHRRWDVLSYTQGGKALLLERDFYQYDPDPWAVLLGPRLNTIELKDLSAWPEVYDPVNF